MSPRKVDAWGVGALSACWPDDLPAATDTLELFNVSMNERYMDQALYGIGSSYVTHAGMGEILLHFKRLDIQEKMAMQTVLATGLTMKFFVGMSFFTLLPATAIDTTASQVEVTVTNSDGMTFVTTSAQDYTFIDYISLGVLQNKFIEGGVYSRNAQFVKVGFVLPRDLRQDMNLGLVPLTGMRFAIGTELPETGSSAWINPCYGTDAAPGLFDISNSALRDSYATAGNQECAFSKNLCTNPLTEDLTSSLVEFYFPIGLDTLNSTVLGGAKQYYIFLYFDVVVVDSMGKKSLTKLFAQSKLSQISFTQACDKIQAASTLDQVMTMDVGIGMTSKEQDWDTTMTLIKNVLASSNDAVDGVIKTKALSIQSGLITLALNGMQEMFEFPGAEGLYLSLDDMVSFHFLDQNTFNGMVELLVQDRVFRMMTFDGGANSEIVLKQDAVDLCNSAKLDNDFKCVVRKDIYRDKVVDPFYVYDHATSVGAHDDEQAIQWLTKNILGVSDFAKEYATNFTRMVREKWNVNDRYNRVWYVNPGYKWSVGNAGTTQSVLSLSDKTIIIGVVSLKSSSGAVQGRRLLQYIAGGDVDAVSRGRALLQTSDSSAYDGMESSPLKDSMPPIQNQIDGDEIVSNMLGMNMDSSKWAKLTMRLNLKDVPGGTTSPDIQGEIKRRLLQNFHLVAPSLSQVVMTQFAVTGPPSAASSGRRLLQSGDLAVEEWNGLISVIVQFTSESTGKLGNTSYDTCQSMHETCSIFQSWLGCAFKYAAITLQANASLTSDELAREFCNTQSASHIGQVENTSFKVTVQDSFLEKCRNYFNPADSVFKSCDEVVQFMSWSMSPEPSKPDTNETLKPVYQLTMKVYGLEGIPSVAEQAAAQVIVAEAFHVPLSWVSVSVLGQTTVARRLLQSGVYSIVFIIMTNSTSKISATQANDALPVVFQQVKRDLDWSTSLTVNSFEVPTQNISKEEPTVQLNIGIEIYWPVWVLIVIAIVVVLVFLLSVKMGLSKGRRHPPAAMYTGPGLPVVGMQAPPMQAPYPPAGKQQAAFV
eukprot:763100-Hanusia_phi.AAC.10